MRLLSTRTVDSFRNELEKIAARVRVVHGTNGTWEVLRRREGSPVLSTDPNPPAVYMATQRRSSRGSVEAFARSAARKHGGEPVIASAKIDTKKGWLPFNLTQWGKENIGSLEEAHDLVRELDAGASGARRAEIWRHLNQGVGTWRNIDHAATVRPLRYLKL